MNLEQKLRFADAARILGALLTGAAIYSAFLKEGANWIGQLPLLILGPGLVIVGTLYRRKQAAS
ncbi:MAG: hypothetical protein ABL984_14330 [Pyrinomonadaceae bacterium]